MGSSDGSPGSTPALAEFARLLETRTPLPPRRPGSRRPAASLPSPAGARTKRLDLAEDDVKNGLGRLVLTLVKLLHELLEKQAIRRMKSGVLTDAEVERLGTTLMRQAREIDRLRRAFHLDEADLNLDLGPLGRLL